MKLDVYLDEEMVPVEIPREVLDNGESFFAKMDEDMARGWKIGPTWVENPDLEQRAQVAADRLAVAIETGNKRLASLLAGYIVSRLPGVKAVRIDPNGEPLNTEFWRGA
ncbi:MAG TPA: hypothetical protein ENK54_03555 [Thiotrichales bacterium]|nr:hypothetical protein [Thiotrichales bacterium]